MIGLVIDFYSPYLIIEYETKLYAQEPRSYTGDEIGKPKKLIKSKMVEVEQAYHTLREDVYYYAVITE